MVYKKKQAEEARNEELGNVMDQEREVHGLLFTVVVSNLHDWFDVFHHVSNPHHAQN